eukprot:7921301-Prorocentrum_lima.AAC.1
MLRCEVTRLDGRGPMCRLRVCIHAQLLLTFGVWIMALRDGARGGTKKKSLVVWLESLGGSWLGCVQRAWNRRHLAGMEVESFSCADACMGDNPKRVIMLAKRRMGEGGLKNAEFPHFWSTRCGKRP